MADSAFKRYVDSRMEEIASIRTDDNFAVNEVTRNCLQQILNQVCDEGTVFPIIAPDGEHGIEASWVALHYTVRISVDHNGGTLVILARPEEPYHIESFDKVSADEISQRLGELSDFVKEHNPQWRALFHR